MRFDFLPKARPGGRDLYVLTLAVVAVLLFAVLGATLPNRFLDTDNLASMAVQLSELGLFSVAMTLSLLIGGIDLSVAAVANLSAILAAYVIQAVAPAGSPPAQVWLAGGAALGTVLLTGGFVGWLNGLLIARIGVPSILATLGTMTLFSGLAFGITGGSAVSGLPEQLIDFANGSLIGVPTTFLLFALVWLIVDLIVRKTAFGGAIMLVGASLRVARFSGVHVGSVIIRTHMLSAVIAALAGLASLLRTNSANADYGGSYVLLAILVAVLGGISVAGGAGKLIGVLWAVLILQLLSTGFNMLLLYVSDGNFFRDFVWGFLLLLIMSVTSILRSKRQ
jgi:simple sugar transport system permease protein